MTRVKEGDTVWITALAFAMVGAVVAALEVAWAAAWSTVSRTAGVVVQGWHRTIKQTFGPKITDYERLE